MGETRVNILLSQPDLLENPETRETKVSGAPFTPDTDHLWVVGVV